MICYVEKNIEYNVVGLFFAQIPYLQIWLPTYTQLHEQGLSFQDFIKISKNPELHISAKQTAVVRILAIAPSPRLLTYLTGNL